MTDSPKRLGAIERESLKLAMLLMFIVVLGRFAPGQSVPGLINYQGRLTDSTGTPLAMANYGIQFRLWDSLTNSSPSGLIWGQQKNVNVQANGVFNVVLGAPGGSQLTNPVPLTNNLAFSFSTSNRFLGLTIVSSNGVAIADTSEIAPRQQLFSVPFALSAESAAVATTVSPGSVGAAQIANGAIGAQQIATSGVTSNNLADGSVSLTKLAPMAVGSSVGIGGLALSSTVDGFATSTNNYVDVPGLVVTNITTGRPVWLGLIQGDTTNSACFIEVQKNAGSDAQVNVRFVVNGTPMPDILFLSALSFRAPSGSFQTLCFPGARTNVFKVQILCGTAGNSLTIKDTRLLAKEF